MRWREEGGVWGAFDFSPEVFLTRLRERSSARRRGGEKKKKPQGGRRAWGRPRGASRDQSAAAPACAFAAAPSHWPPPSPRSTRPLTSPHPFSAQVDGIGPLKEGKPTAAFRPYTPTSKREQKGSFDLLVKVYEKGVVSKHFGSLKVGDSLDIKARRSSPAPLMIAMTGDRPVTSSRASFPCSVND